MRSVSTLLSSIVVVLLLTACSTQPLPKLTKGTILFATSQDAVNKTAPVYAATGAESANILVSEISDAGIVYKVTILTGTGPSSKASDYYMFVPKAQTEVAASADPNGSSQSLDLVAMVGEFFGDLPKNLGNGLKQIEPPFPVVTFVILVLVLVALARFEYPVLLNKSKERILTNVITRVNAKGVEIPGITVKTRWAAPIDQEGKSRLENYGGDEGVQQFIQSLLARMLKGISANTEWQQLVRTLIATVLSDDPYAYGLPAEFRNSEAIFGLRFIGIQDIEVDLPPQLEAAAGELEVANIRAKAAQLLMGAGRDNLEKFMQQYGITDVREAVELYQMWGYTNAATEGQFPGAPWAPLGRSRRMVPAVSDDQGAQVVSDQPVVEAE